MSIRYELTFEKIGTARFVGHLDLQTLFQRAFIRAGLPVAYSKGFNPHQLLSFALPLALGMAGTAELVEVELREGTEAGGLVAAVNGTLPQGLRVIGARLMAEGEKAAAGLVWAAEYEVDFGGGEPFAATARLMAREAIMTEKKTKRGTALVDIKPDILNFTDLGGSRLGLRLSAGGERNLKADLAARVILDEMGADGAVRYTRTGLLTRRQA